MYPKLYFRKKGKLPFICFYTVSHDRGNFLKWFEVADRLVLASQYLLLQFQYQNRGRADGIAEDEEIQGQRVFKIFRFYSIWKQEGSCKIVQLDISKFNKIIFQTE